ncbi:MAG: hypothetical protein ABIU55_12390 [Ferruginibacter sp.]
MIQFLPAYEGIEVKIELTTNRNFNPEDWLADVEQINKSIKKTGN